MSVNPETFAKYIETTKGQKGYNYYNLPGVIGQGYGFEELEEKEQATKIQIYKGLCAMSDKEKKERKEKAEARTCHSQATFECLYCDVKGYKQKINNHIFKKHVEDIRKDLVKLVETRKKLVAPISMNFRKGKTVYFCFLCKKHWYSEGDAINHNRLGVCKIEEQIEAIYQYVGTEANPLVPRDDIGIEIKTKTKTDSTKAYWDMQREQKKLDKELAKVNSLEHEVDTINSKLLIEQNRKQKERIAELENRYDELKKQIEKPRSERIYHETKLSIYKSLYVGVIENIAIKYTNKKDRKFLIQFLKSIKLYDDNIDKLKYLRETCNMGDEPKFDFGVDIEKIRDLKQEEELN